MFLTHLDLPTVQGERCESRSRDHLTAVHGQTKWINRYIRQRRKWV